MIEFLKRISGFLLCAVIAITALLLSPSIPIGSVTIAIIAGILTANILKPGEIFRKGIGFSEKHVLSFAIALMGVNLNFLILKELGLSTGILIIAAITVTISAALLFSRVFKFDRKFSLLLGIGNGLCGSSAIAATKDIIGADEEEVGLSIAIINFLGTLGIFLLPFLGAVVLKLTDIHSGILIGNTLQAVGQVVAAGFSLGESAGQTATIVKMARILMLTPVILILIFTFSQNGAGGSGNKKTGRFRIPLFIIGFFLFSLIPTLQLLPEACITIISRVSKYALITAMAGIGLKISFSNIVRDGKSALIIGSLVFIVQIIFSTGMILLFFR